MPAERRSGFERIEKKTVSGALPNEQVSRAKIGAGRQKFPKAARLLKHADFERVYDRGQRHFARSVTVFFLTRESGTPRVGFTVGRTFGGAVQRNRLKRRLREAVRLERQRLNASVDIVVNPKRAALDANFAELQREIGNAFEAITRKLQRSDRT